ncbi:hypothetical protein Syun_006259 [Stephania yunnanensis]|uniref:PHD finger protein ING n=1 Tax=Stephania yunnanensis TaxID=152371 RepID=A0AAP0KXP8_9MAGN
MQSSISLCMKEIYEIAMDPKNDLVQDPLLIESAWSCLEQQNQQNSINRKREDSSNVIHGRVFVHVSSYNLSKLLGLESLPSILQRKYAVMRNLDISLQESQRQNEQRCEQEIEEIEKGIKSGTIAADASSIRFSDDALDEQKHCIRIADEKIALAVQAYDLVDAHIQQLDQYLKGFDEELKREKEKDVAVTMSVDDNTKSGRGAETSKGGRKKTRTATAAAAAAAAAAAVPDAATTDLDLPVDPNEPTYCTCNQVSYGEMVACDNANCKIEWFHFGCVGLKEKPKGKWYCPDCAGPPKRRKGK